LALPRAVRGARAAPPGGLARERGSGQHPPPLQPAEPRAVAPDVRGRRRSRRGCLTGAFGTLPGVADTVRGVDPKTEEADVRRRRLAASAAFYSIASALSRVAGIVREIVVASYYGVTGQMSAFAVAAQIPMLVRGLFAEGALQAGFIPVFTELLERGEKKEAFKVASSMISLICIFLAAFSALFILLAPVVVPLFAPGFDDKQQLKDLTIGLAMVMFPSVILVALTGVVAGMLNAFEHFAAPAIAPLAWNLAIL